MVAADDLSSRRLIYAQNLRSQMLERLELLEVDAVQWRTRYRDKQTGAEWLQRSLDPEYHGGGHPYLVRLPEPTSSELKELASSSSFEDEATIAGLLLRRMEDESRYRR
jgi:hypothetical protein